MDHFFDEDDDFAPTPKMPIWRILIVCILVCIFIVIATNLIFKPAQAEEYRNHEWHEVEGDRCFIQLTIAPVIFTTLGKLGMSGPVIVRTTLRTKTHRIITYSRSGAPYVFDVKIKQGIPGCIMAWRTRYQDHASKGDAQ